MVKAVIQTEPIPSTDGTRDVYVITYGSSKWAIRFHSGPCLKLYNSLEDAIHAASVQARKFGSQVYFEDLKGKRKKIKLPG